jgi:MYXO-CTERM domain-containing protein
MLMRPLATLLASLSITSAAWADASYTLNLPTADPYTKLTTHVNKGSFTDAINFTLDDTETGYVWLFARENAWFGYTALNNISEVPLPLVNNTTEKEWSGVLYPTVKGTVSWFTPGVAELVTVGFDPNNSLYLSGTFGAGDYSVCVSGVATGAQGGDYITKFSFTPSAVPEAGTSAMMAVGLVGLIGGARRRRQRS